MKNNKLETLLESFDEVCDEIYVCGTNLEKRKELLKRRRAIKSQIDALVENEFYSK